MNELPPHVLERINENRLKAIERKRKLEESQAKDNQVHDKGLEHAQDNLSRKAQKATKTSDYRKRVNKADLNMLSDEQRTVYDQVMEGKSAFITGCGGTGKSHLMHSVISGLRDKYGKAAVAVTATTGIAATHIGGSSLHSFAGIGIGEGSLPELLKRVNSNRNARRRWHETKCLIVDEISMLDAELFDKLESLACQIRNVKKPFGGIQLLLVCMVCSLSQGQRSDDEVLLQVGDFLQLPPVAKYGKQVFRQSEKEFVDLLNSIRWGLCTPEITAKLRATMSNKVDGEISATKLYSRNIQVDDINSRSLAMLNTKTLKFTASDTGEQPWLDQLKKNCLAPEVLELKVGAQYINLSNNCAQGLDQRSTRCSDRFQENRRFRSRHAWNFPSVFNRKYSLSLPWSQVARFETTSMQEIEVVIYPEDFNVEANGVVEVLCSKMTVFNGDCRSLQSELKFPFDWLMQ
eukprot:750480-Hanusia_phi.AAC.1